jgi:hypothetical protein
MASGSSRIGSEFRCLAFEKTVVTKPRQVRLSHKTGDDCNSTKVDALKRAEY